MCCKKGKIVLFFWYVEGQMPKRNYNRKRKKFNQGKAAHDPMGHIV
jgi:hypothetical protein